MRFVSSFACASITLAALAALVGCAAEGVDDPLAADLTAAADDDAGAGERVSLPPTSPSPTPVEEPEEKDAGTDTGGKPVGNNNNNNTNVCPAANTCVAATDLGSISGDTGTDTKTTKGAGSAWFKVRVTEDDGGMGGVSLLMKAKLTSPPGENYDLFVYVPSSDARECTTVTKSSKATAVLDSLGVEFGEGGLFANGGKDDRTVTIEVRKVSGACTSTAEWTLDVLGNQL